MENQKKYQISVCGETVRLLSDEKEEYISSIAEYIEKSIKSLNKSGIAFDMPAASQFLFTAVLLTDQLFKQRVELMEAKGELMSVKIELDSVKKEFEQFIIEFDDKG